MPASRRHKLLKKFRFNCNRKRLGRVRRNATLAPPTLPVIKEAWEGEVSVRDNVSHMGLSFDVNATIKIPSTKEFLVKELEIINEETEVGHKLDNSKLHVVGILEKEANALREKKLELPRGQVLWLSYLINKYGDDYKAMARDSRNQNQETWRQLRAKIRTFQSIPSQWKEYLSMKQKKCK